MLRNKLLTKFRVSTQIFRRGWIFALLGVWLAIGLHGCNPAGMRSNAAQTSELVTSILSDVKTFNYALSNESPNIFPLTFEGLISENPLTGEIEPALAKSWQISEDKLKITFTMRDGLKWSDGKPLTVDDVVFTYNDIYLNPDIPTDTRDILKVGEKGLLPTVKKIDANRVEFTTPEPFRPFLGVTGLPILPKHALKESIDQRDSEGKPLFLAKWGVDTPVEEVVVNGPYKLARYQTSQRIIFQRNPYYWQKDPQGKPKPYIERVVWQIVESTDTGLIQFRSGGLDSIAVSPEYFSLLKAQEEQGNFKIYNGGPAATTTFVMFNLNQGRRNGVPLVDPIKSRWFNTVEFRQAVAYGINREAMINNTYRGLGELQNSPLYSESPYYLSPEEGLKVYEYNPEKARQLLVKAGFRYNERGQLLDQDGNLVRFSLLTNTGNRIREAIGAQIKQDLGRIGMTVDFTPLAWSAFLDRLDNTMNWEMSLIGFGAGFEPNSSANLWTPDGGSHMFNLKPGPGSKPIEGRVVYPWEARIGELYVKAAREFDETKRKALYAESQQLTQKYLPLIHLVNPYSLAAVRDRFENIQHSATGGTFWNIPDIKVRNAVVN
ncbi:ABC transporter substrate-binding protein [Calothrix sp. NIES-3974]|uniref:ABC transporter substrate-binding protein n=1 Tax=Calothrix sp. NIES-3974 TaxID=2005462 RepID=UPI000B610B6D|nr:ABC transporter substrate-binding protein [Calothrix sp. NIES-3974]BAZ04596.1 oligopeptide ABC transporter, periplasmic oligopeptide-binding protein [Calothrix sp. NIES-3974]